MVPAPGDPWYLNYTLDPLNAPVTAPPAVAPIPELTETADGIDTVDPSSTEADPSASAGGN
jgi:hypothetical protein